MTEIGGLRVFESELVPLRWRYKRVLGGYMNRWWIRVQEPVLEWVVIEAASAVYVHPLNMPAFREAFIDATLRGRS